MISTHSFKGFYFCDILFVSLYDKNVSLRTKMGSTLNEKNLLPLEQFAPSGANSFHLELTSSE